MGTGEPPPFFGVARSACSALVFDPNAGRAVREREIEAVAAREGGAVAHRISVAIAGDAVATLEHGTRIQSRKTSHERPQARLALHKALPGRSV